jgi:putative tricarboxylic transport membrane protein
MRPGERLLAAAFGLLGLVWVWRSRELAYMDEFAPGAGFLPFWLGVVLVGLVALYLFTARRAPAARSPAARPPAANPGKVAAVAAGLLACIAAIGPLGLAVPLALYLLYLVRLVERRRLPVAVGVAVGTTAAILLVFRVWLQVPLPRGPWGF